MKPQHQTLLLSVQKGIESYSELLGSLGKDEDLPNTHFAAEAAELINSIESREEALEILDAIEKMHEDLLAKGGFVEMSLRVNSALSQVLGGADEWHCEQQRMDYTFGHALLVDAIVEKALEKDSPVDEIDLLLGTAAGMQHCGIKYQIFQSHRAWIPETLQNNPEAKISIFHQDQGLVFEAPRNQP
jgi:hypothetical protein